MPKHFVLLHAATRLHWWDIRHMLEMNLNSCLASSFTDNNEKIGNNNKKVIKKEDRISCVLVFIDVF